MKKARSTPLEGKISQTTDRGHARASEILAAAHEVFVRDGYGGFSVRSVAAQLGMSLSNIQHYYPSKDHLVQAMLLSAAARYQTVIDEIVAGMPEASQLERFMAAMEMFLADARQPMVGRTLVQMWAAALVDPLAAKTLAKIQRRERKTILELIRGISSELSDAECEARAALIVAQIEGLILLHAGNRITPVSAAEHMDGAARLSFRWLATRKA
ncbi:TetR/AcrR family transcriptional regulator [Noviherbaspirillum massiliense]|uniref:TetR/AcrR family transcriptional regulator n=1 Tax=Noviherbaspirillum massiliense TaxID=1465823 RepID=UPI000307C23A|nr:TetR/AcrR family transcriptional regulator [Noviherbaspirillum massiliense]